MAPARAEPAASLRMTAGAAGRWSDLSRRAVSALVLGPIALGAIWFGAEWFMVFVAAGTAVLAWEWVHLCGARLRAFPGLAVPLALLAAGLASVAGAWILALGLLGAGAAVAWAIARQPALLPGERRPAAWLAAGVVYIGLAGVGLIWLRDAGDAGRANVLFVVLVVWASDIGAYVAGRMIGGPRLAPAVSPNKTWSGGAGGLVAAIAAGIGVAAVLTPGVAPASVMLVAAAIGLTAQCGDLLESFIKRRFAVKDTSRLIPGHGGLLDRADGLIAAVPVAAALSLALGQGTVLWG
ncbi:phosphatidate cytidylyltransferase [Elioraea sp.]|uniref:phosphatidate cytidylyltransferase n=1 Tax=Elioraea sp. TaxID=2185103 RepID=UPI003F703237